MNAQVAATPPRSSRRYLSWLAWSAWALSVAILIALVVFQYLNDPSTLLSDAFGALVLLAFATVGALIISRRPGNRIGWIFCTGALLWILDGLALEYAVYALITAPRLLSGGEWAAWFGGWMRPLGFFLIVVFSPLLFPNGELPSPRWRPVAWFALGYELVFTVLSMFAPTNDDFRLASVRNPLGITFAPDVWDSLNTIGLLIGPIAVACAFSVISRFRRAESEERQQLKWFVYAVALAVVVLAGIIITIFLAPPSVLDKFSPPFFDLAVAGFPIAVGIAILKYRLYEIDLLINRTLVYVPLTAILAGIFAASISLTQRFFIALTGQTSDAATVLTTLIVVAAFDPLKTGLQHLVERRFKEGAHAANRLKTFRQEVKSVIQVFNAEQISRRFLEEVTAAYDVLGGVISLGGEGQAPRIYSVGVLDGKAKLELPLDINGKRVGKVQLGPRRNGADYTPVDAAGLREDARLVAEAIALAERTAGPVR